MITCLHSVFRSTFPSRAHSQQFADEYLIWFGVSLILPFRLLKLISLQKTAENSTTQTPNRRGGITDSYTPTHRLWRPAAR